MIAKYICDGKPKSEDIYNALIKVVKKKSVIYHDSDSSRDKLVNELELISYGYKAKLPNGKYNEEALEVLKPMNDECKNLNFFLINTEVLKRKRIFKIT